MKLTLSMKCDHKGCKAKLELEAVISDNAKNFGTKYEPEVVIANLGWRRDPDTRRMSCPDHPATHVFSPSMLTNADVCLRCGENDAHPVHEVGP